MRLDDRREEVAQALFRDEELAILRVFTQEIQINKPRILLVAFSIFILSSRDQALACDIERTSQACAQSPCASSAQAEFQNYVESEKRCGVEKQALPYVLNAEPGKGKKGTIVLVHGLTAGPDHMKIMANEFTRQGYNVVVPLLKGHGGGDDLLMQASIEEWKKDVDFAGATAEKLGKPIHIIGHSTGGMLAAVDASEHRGRYKSLTGLDPVFNFGGPMGTQMKYPCLAKHVWNYPSEIPAGVNPFAGAFAKECNGNGMARRPDVIAFEINHHIEDILSKTCGGIKIPLPHFNYERPLQALCALKSGVDELSPEQIRALPPTHLELTKDPSIFDYEDRNQLVADVKANPDSSVNDLETNEIEPNSFHELMMAPCAQHYKPMQKRIVSWIKQHSN